MSLASGIAGGLAGYMGGKMMKEDKERQERQDKLMETYLSAMPSLLTPSTTTTKTPIMKINPQQSNPKPYISGKKDGGMVGKDNYSKGYAYGGMVGKDKTMMYADGGMIYEYDPNEFSIYCGDKMMVQKKNFKK